MNCLFWEADFFLGSANFVFRIVLLVVDHRLGHNVSSSLSCRSISGFSGFVATYFHLTVRPVRAQCALLHSCFFNAADQVSKGRAARALLMPRKYFPTLASIIFDPLPPPRMKPRGPDCRVREKVYQVAGFPAGNGWCQKHVITPFQMVVMDVTLCPVALAIVRTVRESL